MDLLENILSFLGYNSIYLTAFLIGILGGVHCLGMCGGIVTSLTFNLKIKTGIAGTMPYQIFYNLGRVSSYVILGLVFGLLGQGLNTMDSFLPAQKILLIFSGIFMIAVGLYLGGWWYGVVKVETLGNKIWQKVLPLTKKFNQVQYLHQAYIYGILWGWIPCGLVYSAAIMAMASGSVTSGATTMLAFGLGTMPNLLLMGVFAFYFSRLSRNKSVRHFAGISVIFLGVLQIYESLQIQ